MTMYMYVISGGCGVFHANNDKEAMDYVSSRFPAVRLYKESEKLGGEPELILHKINDQ